MHRQPLLHHGFVKMLRGMVGLYAPEALDQPAPQYEFVHVATDGHFRNLQQLGQLLVRAGPNRVEMLDNRALAAVADSCVEVGKEG